MSIPILDKPSASLDHAKAWARQRRAARLQDVDAYLTEIWRLCAKVGYDPAVAAAQSSHETGGWTANWWTDALNPAGIGVTGVAGVGLRFRSPIEAARAHAVHLAVYARPTVLHRLPPEWIALDGRFTDAWLAGYAGKAKSIDDLGGRWAADEGYGPKIEQHWRGIKDAVVAPKPTPQPTPGGAPLPAGIVQVPTGNWHERTFGQQPVAIVYHITDDMNFANVRGWFQNPVSNASSHVVIDRDGTIYQFVSSGKAAWTNGDFKRSRTDIAWLTAAIAQSWPNGPRNLNDFTINIEHVGTPGNPPSEAQYRSSIAISKYWRDRYGIKPNRAHLLRHGDINSVDRSYCPGPSFDLARVIRELGGDPADMTS